jgi:hypothetical protein
MLFVRTRLGIHDSIHGIGLFAAQDIARGSLIWRFAAGFDEVMSHARLMELRASERADVMRFGYVSRFTGLIVISGDDYVYMNHSHRPNVGVSPLFEGPEGMDIALRDIRNGEELLFDYTWFGEDPCCRQSEPRLPPLESFSPIVTGAGAR